MGTIEQEIQGRQIKRTHDLISMLAHNYGVQGNISEVFKYNAESEATFGKPIVDLSTAVVRAHLARHDLSAAVDYAAQV